MSLLRRVARRVRLGRGITGPVLPAGIVERVVSETGAQDWFIWAVRNWSSRGEAVSAMTWLARNLGRDAQIFETGCGCGANLIWLGQHGFAQRAGSDVSPEAIAAARRLTGAVNLPVALTCSDALIPSEAMPMTDALIAVNWTYYVEEFELGRFLSAYRRLLRPGACVVVDVVDRAFDAMPDNEYMTDDWKLPRSERRPTQYKVRMSRDEVVERARASGFHVRAFLPGTHIPPRFVAVISRP